MITRVLVPSGALGLGFEEEALARGVATRPDIIVIDGGSTDSGPFYLGTGTSKYSRATTTEQWERLMKVRAQAGVPLMIGSAGTCGADTAVDWMVDITSQIACRQGCRLRLAVLKSGQTPTAMVDAFAQGYITPLDPAPPLSAAMLQQCSNIVALAGVEQLQAALATGADIIIAGRASDAALIAALPLARGCHAGAAWHGAKIGECGALATTHPESGTVMLEFDDNGCTIEPMGAQACATPRTVAAHMLYENADPLLLHEPGGYLKTDGAQYLALDERRVRLTGAHWNKADAYRVKLEGARRIGFQTISLVLLREPEYVARAHEWCARIVDRVTQQARQQTTGKFHVELRVIGADATLGALETRTAAAGHHEIGVLGIVTAASDEQSQEIARMLNPLLLHHGLHPEGEVPTFAFPFSPPEIPRGPVWEFCLNHVLTLDDPMEPFRLDIMEIGA